MLDALLAGLQAGDRRSLARLLTLSLRDDLAGEIRARLSPADRPARVLAVTGAGGVGKSSLIGRVIAELRSRGQSVAVLACDPESPLTGGALLGDRFRMPGRPDDLGVFIRSVAAPSGRQAVANNLDLMVSVCERFGFDIVLIETVGAGQGDTAVHKAADAVILLVQPESGDDLQWEKAGVLEVADAIVVHKADLPGADRTVAQLQSMQALSPHRAVPVMAVSSRTGAGITDLATWLESVPLRRSEEAGKTTPSTRLLAIVQAELAARWPGLEMADVLAAWQAGTLSAQDASSELLRRAAATRPV